MRLRDALLPALAAAGIVIVLGQGLSQETAPPGRQRLLDSFSGPSVYSPGRNPVFSPGEFSGYTNFWQTIFWTWFRRGGLFQMSVPTPELAYNQSLVDAAEELGVPGLYLREGFIAGLLEAPYRELDNPTPDDLEETLGQTADNLLVFAGEFTDVGRTILQKAKYELRPGRTRGHQFQAADFHSVPAVILESGTRKLFAVVTDAASLRARVRELIALTVETLRRFDLHRGWFGTGTLLHSVTCFPGHPLEVIGQGLDQGNDWFTFSGYMDFLIRKDLPAWLAEVGLDVVTDVGTGKATHSLGTLGFGCRDWDGLKLQDMPTEEEWIEFVKSRGGYIFRPVFAPECDKYKYDGQIAVEGNKRQIDAEDAPFILNTGMIREDAPPCMVLFAEKGTSWTREAMWEAILGRRAVGVLPQAKMVGPARFRNVLQILLLDNLFLDRAFGDNVQIQVRVGEPYLSVGIQNRGETPVKGRLEIRTGTGLEVLGESSKDMAIPGRQSQAHSVRIGTSSRALGRANPILAEFTWEGGRKRSLAVNPLPPAISVHKLLYGQTPEVEYPVALFNYTSEFQNAEIRLKVVRAGAAAERVYEIRRLCPLRAGEWRETLFKIPLPPGSYEAVVSALGTETQSQLGVEAAAGTASVAEADLNGDGIKEYILENGKVKATLLAIGARVIEYIVKKKNDNVFFKLWPAKEVSTDRRPFRERGFYPYGGFEDFLGQASIETHKVYEAEVVKSQGTYVQVKMKADYYGNILEKTFTLYGDSPLLEVRFALDFRNPELNMLGPQPILELGKRHWTEDIFVAPGRNGLEEYRMRPEEYFGRVIFLQEGWNAGYDPEEDVSFVGAFPVSEPEFLHIWMNHPSNGESNHYYAEFQPWVPIFQKTRRYFSYYMWADAGDWRLGLEELRKRNLITTK